MPDQTQRAMIKHTMFFILMISISLPCCKNEGTDISYLEITDNSAPITISSLKSGNDKIAIDKVYDQNYRLVIYLCNLGCAPCCQKELEILNSIPESIQRNIDVWGKFNSNREYRIFANNTPIKVYRVSRDEKPFESCDYNSNYIFFLKDNDKAISIGNLTDDPGLSIYYYNAISKYMSGTSH